MFKSLFQNPQLIILMLADLAKWCVKFVTAASAIYYFRDAAGNPGLMVPYALCIALAAMVGAYIVRFWVKAMPARTITIISYVGMALFLFLIPMADETIQTMVAGRSSEVFDMFIDGGGILFGGFCGYVLILILCDLFRPRKKQA